MPIYEYKAYTEGGGETQGRIDADTPREARDRLRMRKVHVVEMAAVDFAQGRAAPAAPSSREAGGGAGPTPARRRGASAGLGRRLGDFLDRGNPQEITLLTRQFATLLSAGIAVSDALKALVEQVGDRRVENAFRDVREKVTQGMTLAEALAHHPKYFSDLYCNMIKAGEASGNLEAILVRLAAYMQKQQRLKGKVGAALAYPAILVLLGAGVVMYLMTNVVPKITKIITDRGNVLPAPTQILITTSDFIRDYWYLVILALVGAVAAYRMFVSTDGGRLFMDRLMLRLPLLGDLFKKQAVSRFSTTFATLLRSGIPVLECLTLLKRLVGNMVLARVLEELRARILEGADIAGPLKKSGVFPPVVGYMISVGEQTGHLDEVLERIAESYDEEIDLTTQKVTAMAEPIIIAAMAGVVGFIVISIMLPIVQMQSV